MSKLIFSIAVPGKWLSFIRRKNPSSRKLKETSTDPEFTQFCTVLANKWVSQRFEHLDIEVNFGIPKPSKRNFIFFCVWMRSSHWERLYDVAAWVYNVDSTFLWKKLNIATSLGNLRKSTNLVVRKVALLSWHSQVENGPSENFRFRGIQLKQSEIAMFLMFSMCPKTSNHSNDSHGIARGPYYGLHSKILILWAPF